MIDASRLSFLGPGFKRLRQSTITVIGAGGGGSHIVQQTAHLGVGTIAVIDPDILERSNVNRVPGSTYRDIGRPKATVLADRFSGLGSRIVPVLSRGESDEARAWIERSDVVFGAVDGARSRNNLEAICRHALVPYIDIGLSIDVLPTGEVQAIGGQIVTSIAGGPCLRCADVVTDATIVADREEYVAGAPEQQVISMNGVLASQAVNAALSLITDYAPHHPPPAVLLYDGLLNTLTPDRHISDGCPHYPIGSIGWAVRLPARRAV
jgi:hypothetical protein